jgi:hypothetical protein
MHYGTHDSMINKCEQPVEQELVRETEVVAGNLPVCYFAHLKSHRTWLIRDRAQAADVGSRRLTVWATARPNNR